MLARARFLAFIPLKQNQTTDIKSDGGYRLPLPILNHVDSFIQ